MKTLNTTEVEEVAGGTVIIPIPVSVYVAVAKAAISLLSGETASED